MSQCCVSLEFIGKLLKLCPASQVAPKTNTCMHMYVITIVYISNTQSSCTSTVYVATYIHLLVIIDLVKIVSRITKLNFQGRAMHNFILMHKMLHYIANIM